MLWLTVNFIKINLGLNFLLLYWTAFSRFIHVFSFLSTFFFMRTGLALIHPWGDLECCALFKGTSELFSEGPPFIAEYIALWLKILLKGYRRCWRWGAVSPSILVIHCLVQGHFNRQPLTVVSYPDHLFLNHCIMRVALGSVRCIISSISTRSKVHRESYLEKD